VIALRGAGGIAAATSASRETKGQKSSAVRATNQRPLASMLLRKRSPGLLYHAPLATWWNPSSPCSPRTQLRFHRHRDRRYIDQHQAQATRDDDARRVK
jgi:hypothetical protein